MGRHVERVRRGGRELGVAVGRLQPALGERRVVVGMDQVVHDARVVRLARELRLQDLGRLELPRVGLVGRQCCDVERERMVDRGLGVVRIARVELRHRLLVGQHARAMVLGVGIAVELRERGDVARLARALGPKLARLLQRCPTLGQVLGRRRRERVGEERHGDPPMGHRAFGIALQHLGERVVRGLVPERMLQLHRLVEGLLRLGRAGDREVDRAEHLMAGMLVGGARRHRGQA